MVRLHAWFDPLSARDAQVTWRGLVTLRAVQAVRAARSCVLMLWAGGAVSCLVGCASIPKGQYGVDEIEWRGVDDFSSQALASCLVTREREHFTVRLGLGAPSCGEPPFDSAAPRIELWTLPWTDWSVYDPAIFDVEKQRIERWYHARGHYDAHVTSVKTYVGDREVDPDECHGSGSDCELKVVVQIDEGKPTIISDVELKSNVPLMPKLWRRLRNHLALRAGERFDEASYEADKQGLLIRLQGDAYARAQVSGRVVVDRQQRTARVSYSLEPGPKCVFGRLNVEGAADVPVSMVIEAADIPSGEPYSPDVVDDAQRAIFALGVFSSVRLVPQGQGSTVDMRVVLQRGRVANWSAGVGMMSGTLQRATSDETASVPQWDVHLRGRYENRNFLGGLRKLRIEERPRLIMLAEFPRIIGQDRKIGKQVLPGRGPQPGNVISVNFEQPATLEARTKLITSGAWDLGPDPFLGFFRHDVAVKFGFERPFWRQRINARIAVEHDLYDVIEPKSQTPDGVSDYKLPFLEQQFVLDLRDNPVRPKLGAYLSVLVHEASRLGGYGAWNYLRVLPEVRTYVPIFWDIVIAARFALGALFVFDYASELDMISQRLGPQTYRLRGGGANSNRGFLAGRLGDGLDGGTRRWEGSLEVRAPLGSDFGITFFGDIGDVFGDVMNSRRDTPFRFSHLNTSLGFGLRYFSILGAVRFDAAWLVPGWQTIGAQSEDTSASDEAMAKPIKVGILPSAIHLTIGEAF